MKVDNRITSLAVFSFGTAIFAVMLSLLSMEATSTMAKSLSIGAERVFLPAQVADAGLAIFGLALGAGIALGVAGVGAGLGMGTASAAALGAITEKPETFGKSILYVVFIEAVAIYGFVIAFLLVGYIPNLIG